MAFDRIARTVRRTVALLRVLDVPVAPVVERRALVRRQVIRAVEDTIEADHGDGERAESLRAELYERMDAPEFEEDLGRPVEEVIADIRRDLGIAGRPGMRHPWKRRTPGEVAALFARASSRGPEVEARMVVSAPFRGG